MYPYSQFILSKDKVSKSNEGLIDANYTQVFGSQRIAAHWVKLLPQQRSSYPHAESLEEEFIYIVSGRPHVWINGYIYQLEPGHAVGFPAGTGIAHCFLNNTHDDVEMIVLGDRTKKENKCSFPINHELKNSRAAIWWNDYPKQSLGGHNGAVGNLNFLRDVAEIPFIKSIKDLNRSKSYSYNNDSETFTFGVRLTDHLGLQTVGVWHEQLPMGKRSSWPHAHSREEEFAIILKGKVTVWLNGTVQMLQPGDCVYFKPGINLAHTLMNESDELVEYIGFGEAADLIPADKIFYPLHDVRNQECIEENFFWTDVPQAKDFGLHLGIPLNPNIRVQEFKSAQDFLDTAADVLYKKEAEYGLMLGLTEPKTKSPLGQDKNKYISVDNQQGVLGFAVVTDKNTIITTMPASLLQSLVLYLNKNQIQVPGVVGPSHSAEAFARIYSQTNSIAYKIAMDQKIYQLDRVIEPRPTDGQMIVAANEHIDLVTDWFMKFVEESLPNEPVTLEDAKKIATGRIQNQDVFIWMNDSGQEVALNMRTRPTKNGVAISFVYTPKEARGKGYASAVVAQTSQRMLDSGKKFCMLYTDIHNPTSNSIYQKIGYNEIATSKNFIFLK